MDTAAAEVQEALRGLKQVLEALGSDYALVNLAEEVLPEGTIDVELGSVWSIRDLTAEADGLWSDWMLTDVESLGWAIIARSADGRTFRIRPTTVASIES